MTRKHKCAKCGTTEDILENGFALAESKHRYKGEILTQDYYLCVKCDDLWEKLWRRKGQPHGEKWFELFFEELIKIKRERFIFR